MRKFLLSGVAALGLMAGAAMLVPSDAHAWGWNSGPSWSYSQGQQQGYATVDANPLPFPGFSIDKVTQTQAAHPIGAGTAVNTQTSVGWSFGTGFSLHTRYADQYQESAGND